MNRLSLRLRLLFAVSAITLVALGIADIAVYGALRSNLYDQVDSTLLASHSAVEATAQNPGRALHAPPGSIGDDGGPPGGKTPGAAKDQATSPGPDSGGSGPSSTFCQIGRETASGMFIEVRSASGTVVTGVAGKEECPAFQPGGRAYSPKIPAVITGFARRSSDPDELSAYFTVPSTVASGPLFRVRASKLDDGGTLLLATPIAGLHSTLAQLLLVEILVTGGALLAAILLGLWLVRVSLHPLRDVERTAEAIAGGDLMHRVPNVNPRTEVGHLATAFNVMLERIEDLVGDLRSSESRLRRFVGDASHELRTPIAAISAYAQLFGKGAASRQDDLERAMSGIERESSRMGRLVEDLLTLAKLDEHQLLEAEPVELTSLALEAVETARTVGPEWPIAFVADDALEVLGDRSALRRVIDNLLANVRSHTPLGTAATVTVGSEAGQAFVEIADEGPGFSEEEGRLIFERFFRADPSRSRETGGAGLGLAIVASIVEVHRGRVLAEPRPGGGAVFKVTLPLLREDPLAQ